MKIAAAKVDPMIFIAAVFFIRIFALFSFIPLLGSFEILQGHDLTPWVLASYPFFQACGQIPCGVASDYFGRLFVIRSGLIVFALASLACFFSPNIYIFLVARSIQGLCAIGAPTQALLADLSVSSKQLHSRYYLIGIFIVLGLISGFLAAFFAQAAHFPGLVFLLTALYVVILLGWSLQLPAFFIHHEPAETYQPITIEKALIFLANASLHFIQSFSLGAMHYVMRNTAYDNPSLLMGLCLASAICICMAPLRRREYAYSLYFSLLLSLGLWGPYVWWVCIAGSYAPPLFVALTLIFSLLLLLEAALPTGLKKYAKGSGLTLGLYNTFQYGSMSIGALLITYGSDIASLLLITAVSSIPLTISLIVLYRTTIFAEQVTPHAP